jgi:hypothetical protein
LGSKNKSQRKGVLNWLGTMPWRHTVDCMYKPISALVWGKWSASCSDCFTCPLPTETAECTHWIAGWVGLTTGLDDVEKKHFLPLLGLNIRHSQLLENWECYPGSKVHISSQHKPILCQWGQLSISTLPVYEDETLQSQSPYPIVFRVYFREKCEVKLFTEWDGKVWQIHAHIWKALFQFQQL